MDPSSDYPISTTPGRREVQLQGPRPSPLRVSKDSHKIKKPPMHSQPLQSHRVARTTTITSSADETRQPIIIYAVSPKVIHADPSNFMAIVQRLTGLASTSAAPPAADEFAAGVDGLISPATRLASIEKTSPGNNRGGSERQRDIINNSSSIDVVGLELGGEDSGQIRPGILSPSPSNFPGISPELFSPAVDMQAAVFGFPDVFSPLMFGHTVLPSPSGFLSSSPKFYFDDRSL